LVVVADGIAATHPLPATGTVVVGRAPECDVQIDDPSISRTHAALHLSGALSIEDLGSANGTRVRDDDLEPGTCASIAVGEVVELGSTMLIVQRRAGDVSGRRIWTHDYFEGRLEDECARARRRGSLLAVIRVHSETPSSAPELRETFVELLRPEDVIGCYGPDDFELLLLDTEENDARALAARLVTVLADREVEIRTGVACMPGDGRNAHALMARACAEVQRSPAEEARERHVVVADPAMEKLYKLIERVSAGTISVLLMGETGVGKEVIAEAVHRYSPRTEKELLRLNCAAFTETLLESELFGHEKGAFTGATGAKTGLLESADGGTVFLDEVGELPLSLQAKLLRVIEERQVMRVGGLKAKPIDVRFVSATNRDLEAEIASGRFREDLYFRLNGVSLVIPPLRERVGEIEKLARQFAVEASQQLGQASPPELPDDVLARLKSYPWPGNIRELRNVIERAVLLAVDEPISLEHLPLEKMGEAVAEPAPEAEGVPKPRASERTVPARRGARDLSDDELIAALRAHDFQVNKAAPDLGVSRSALYERMKACAQIRMASEVTRAEIEECHRECSGDVVAMARKLDVSRRALQLRIKELGIG
jgi:transcriptional regulator with PAS, ATPase and Fis domain